MIDKFGRCPRCQANWDAGEITASLTETGVFFGKNKQDIEKIARQCFGWSEENRKRFSRAMSVNPQLDNGISVEIIVCPECRIHIIAETGARFDTFSKAIESLITVEDDTEQAPRAIQST